MPGGKHQHGQLALTGLARGAATAVQRRQADPASSSCTGARGSEVAGLTRTPHDRLGNKRIERSGIGVGVLNRRHGLNLRRAGASILRTRIGASIAGFGVSLSSVEVGHVWPAPYRHESPRALTAD